MTAMLDLAIHFADKPVALAEISNRQDISLSYLEQLFSKMRRMGLVQSVRGPGGGYMLVNSPDNISVADIIKAVDEPIQATSCDDTKTSGCQGSSRCITHNLWQHLGQHIVSYLDSVTLSGLIETGPHGSIKG